MRLNIMGYFWAKILQKVITHTPETICKFYRRVGVQVGRNNVICCYLQIGEPQLVEIKNDCVISSDVSFITHDHSISKVTDKGSNLYGKIIIGNNCFIGQRSTILYGVELADNIIVGSGSVVTTSFKESNIIIVGNPARIIGTWNNFRKKYENKAAFKSEYEGIIQGSTDKLICK